MQQSLTPSFIRCNIPCRRHFDSFDVNKFNLAVEQFTHSTGLRAAPRTDQGHGADGNMFRK